MTEQTPRHGSTGTGETPARRGLTVPNWLVAVLAALLVAAGALYALTPNDAPGDPTTGPGAPTTSSQSVTTQAASPEETLALNYALAVRSPRPVDACQYDADPGACKKVLVDSPPDPAPSTGTVSETKACPQGGTAVRVLVDLPPGAVDAPQQERAVYVEHGKVRADYTPNRSERGGELCDLAQRAIQ